VTRRGDTDFSHTQHLDRWDAQGTQFILGLDAHAKVAGLAEALPAQAWTKLERLPRHEILTEPRTKPDRVKEAIVREKGFQNLVLVGEDVAEIEYRLVIVRKNLSVQRGEQVLFDEVRYLFYLSNRRDLDRPGVVAQANGRSVSARGGNRVRTQKAAFPERHLGSTALQDAELRDPHGGLVRWRQRSARYALVFGLAAG
jgi:hypothetical protein